MLEALDAEHWKRFGTLGYVRLGVVAADQLERCGRASRT